MAAIIIALACWRQRHVTPTSRRLAAAKIGASLHRGWQDVTFRC
jgi:hypothetical protein